MFAFTKVVKLIGLFLRNPSDVIYLPLSIVFGYFHGLIKLYALLTLNMVGLRYTLRFKSRPLTRSADIVGQPRRWGYK